MSEPADIAEKLRWMSKDTRKRVAAPLDVDLQEAANEIERLRRLRDELLSYLNGISRQTAAMVKANSPT